MASETHKHAHKHNTHLLLHNRHAHEIFVEFSTAADVIVVVHRRRRECVRVGTPRRARHVTRSALFFARETVEKFKAIECNEYLCVNRDHEHVRDLIPARTADVDARTRALATNDASVSRNSGALRCAAARRSGDSAGDAVKRSDRACGVAGVSRSQAGAADVTSHTIVPIREGERCLSVLRYTRDEITPIDNLKSIVGMEDVVFADDVDGDGDAATGTLASASSSVSRSASIALAAVATAQTHHTERITHHTHAPIDCNDDTRRMSVSLPGAGVASASRASRRVADIERRIPAYAHTRSITCQVFTVRTVHHHLIC
jgi:hypothetical protein